MRKMVLILAVLLVLLCAMVAVAVEAQPGETVSIPVSINANGAAYIGLSISYDTSIFDYVSINCTGPNAQATGTTMMMYVTSGSVPSGQVGTITLKVKEGTSNGTYQVNVSVTGAYDLDENPVNASASGGSVTVKAAPCTHTSTEEKVTKEATCTQTGTKQIVCKNCGEVIKTETIPALGHDFGDYVQTTAPTCVGKGEETSTCSRCDEKQTREVPALGHKFGEYNDTIAATCTEPGERTGYCIRCNQTTTQEIPPLGHDFGSYEQTTAPTCTEKGEETSSCSRCDEKQTREVAALDHDFGDYFESTAPTCTEKGEATATCSRCSETKTKEIPAKGHKWSTWTEDPKATCTTEGKKTRTCEHGCGESEEQTVAALGHNGVWKVITPATTTTEGLKQKICTRCSEVLEESVIPVLKITNRNAFSAGLTLAELGLKANTYDTWKMITPIDLTKKGTTAYPLIAGNVYEIGHVIVTISDDTFTAELEIDADVEINSAQLILIASKDDIKDFNAASYVHYDFPATISLEDLPGDTILMMTPCQLLIDQRKPEPKYYNFKSDEHKALIDDMKAVLAK